MADVVAYAFNAFFQIEIQLHFSPLVLAVSFVLITSIQPSVASIVSIQGGDVGYLFYFEWVKYFSIRY